MDLTSIGKRNVTGEETIVESKTPDNTIAIFFYANALLFNVVDLSFNACPEALTDFFTLCDKIHGEGSAESGISFKRRNKVQYSQETSPGQMLLRFIPIERQW